MVCLALSFAGRECAAQTNAFAYQGRRADRCWPASNCGTVLLLAMPQTKAGPPAHRHSIITVLANGDPKAGGRDGVVAYSSAHLDPVSSEFIVRGPHSCLNHPATIEEVRRILHEHLDQSE
jgi:hypothetical protein